MADRFVLVNFMVVEDGGQGHPMNVEIGRVDLDETGTSDPTTMAALMARIDRAVRRMDAAVRRARKARTNHTEGA